MKVDLELTDIQLIIIKDALNNHWREAEIKLTEKNLIDSPPPSKFSVSDLILDEDDKKVTGKTAAEKNSTENSDAPKVY